MALNLAQLEALWVQAGGSQESAPTAAAIAMAESSGRPDAPGDYDSQGNATSIGLWQIHWTVHPQFDANKLSDPRYNAAAAVSLWKDAGGTSESFRDWSTYTGAIADKYGNIVGYENPPPYAKYLGQAKRIALGNYDPLSYTAATSDTLIEQGINLATGGAYDAAKEALVGVENAASSVLGLIENLLTHAGPLFVAVAFIGIGGLLLAFSFGDRLAGSAEKIVEKIGPAAAQVGEVLA